MSSLTLPFYPTTFRNLTELGGGMGMEVPKCCVFSSFDQTASWFIAYVSVFPVMCVVSSPVSVRKGTMS
jgi:hypothetical protein